MNFVPATLNKKSFTDVEKKIFILLSLSLLCVCVCIEVVLNNDIRLKYSRRFEKYAHFAMSKEN